MTPTRTYLDYLGDIVTAVEDIAAFTDGMDEATFVGDRRTQYAVIRALEIIGEATKRLPTSVFERYPQVPWRFMARMRDRIIHGYDTVDPAIVWQTVTHDLPSTRADVDSVLAEERRLHQT